jgi:hypothetical protein
VSLLVLPDQFPRTKRFLGWQTRRSLGVTAVAPLIFLATATGAGLIAPDLSHGANRIWVENHESRTSNFTVTLNLSAAFADVLTDPAGRGLD